jgi:hypothetical protein
LVIGVTNHKVSILTQYNIDLSKLDFKAECYETVGIWIKTFLYPNQQEWERECAKAPNIDYVINCINANPETSVTTFEPVIYNVGK